MSNTQQKNSTDKSKKKTSEYSFWDAFRFTKNGRVKSSTLVNTFSLGIAILAINAVAAWFLIDVVENLLGDKGLPVFLMNFLESLVPAIAATAICCGIQLLCKNKTYMFYGYLWNAFYLIVFVIANFVLLKGHDLAMLLQLTAMVTILPLAVGLTCTYLIKKKAGQ